MSMYLYGMEIVLTYLSYIRLPYFPSMLVYKGIHPNFSLRLKWSFGGKEDQVVDLKNIRTVTRKSRTLTI